MEERERYHGLDVWRGCTMCSMVLYHAVWDLVYLFGKEWSWFEGRFAHWWQQSICWSFILLSGFCWNLGKKKWKRASAVLGAGIIVALVMNVMQDDYVWFGVLLFIGMAMFCMIVLDKVLVQVHPVWGILVSFVLFVITRNCNTRFLGFEEWNLIALPDELYANWITTCVGFPLPGYSLMDYFGLFPWLFLYIAGYFLYKVFEKNDWMRWCYAPRCCFLEWMGKHALIVYILHQPLIYGILFVLYKIL